MKCRFCGDTLTSTNQKLFTTLGIVCKGNPAKVHIGITDSITCVYCGDTTKSQNGFLLTRMGKECKNSPTGMHCLQ